MHGRISIIIIISALIYLALSGYAIGQNPNRNNDELIAFMSFTSFLVVAPMVGAWLSTSRDSLVRKLLFFILPPIGFTATIATGKDPKIVFALFAFLLLLVLISVAYGIGLFVCKLVIKSQGVEQSKSIRRMACLGFFVFGPILLPVSIGMALNSADHRDQDYDARSTVVALVGIAFQFVASFLIVRIRLGSD